MNCIVALGNLLPQSLQFLHVGWFVIHLIAIPVVFAIGFAVGKRKRG
ncbi:MAG: hypothetical protein PHU85_13245 [Phycisphaerae bacterium]|nr:hypothetical protein [Phycisphaerae bacterium]